tara:strand:- start:3482 stop:5038 length:1557 start_codon:yes stop_codon:yes gene_type:complete
MADTFDSPFDTVDAFAPELIAESAPVLPRPVAPSLVGASRLGSTEEAFSNLGAFRNQQEGQSRALADMARESGDFSNIKNRDINKLQRDPTGQLKDYYTKEVDNNVVDYVKQNELPTYQEAPDGTKLFLNTGSQESIMRVAGDDHKKGGHYEASGPVGTYSSVWVENLSSVEELATNPYISMGASFIPGATAALMALKVATGQKITPQEIILGSLDGLKVTGMLKAPATAAKAAQAGTDAMNAANAAGAVDAVAQGAAAQAAALAGKGLGNLSYAQTSGLMRAAASGDLKGAVLTYFGPDLLDKGLETVGLDPAMVSQLGISDREFKTGLSTAAAALAEGGSLDDALKSGFINYIQEGGSFGSWTDNISPDIDFGVVGDAVSWLADKIQTGASALGDLVNPLDDRLDDVTPDTVKDIVSSAGRDFEDWLKDTATGMLTGAAGAALLGGGDNGFTMPAFSPSSTGTTDKLFGDKELFKFKNRIELSEFKDIEAGTPVSIEEFLTSPFESDFAQTQERFI